MIHSSLSSYSSSDYYHNLRMTAYDHEYARSRIDPLKQRVTQTNMVYLIGLPEWMAKEETIRKQQYCGQYGNISKILIKKGFFNSFPSYSAYITYDNDEAACLAVLGINNLVFDKNRIYASYGTNKYCAQFINYGKCKKSECPFFHEICAQKQIVEEDNKRIFQQQQNLARKYFIQNYENINFDNSIQSVFLSSSEILEEFIKEGLILPLMRKSSIVSEHSTNGSSSVTEETQTKSQFSACNSPQKRQLNQEQQFNISQKILFKLQNNKTSILKLIESQPSEQFNSISRLLMNSLSSILDY